MARSSRQKINKEIVVLNVTVVQINLIDSCRTSHAKTTKYTLFHMHMEHFPRQITLGQKTSLNKLNKMDII